MFNDFFDGVSFMDHLKGIFSSGIIGSEQWKKLIMEPTDFSMNFVDLSLVEFDVNLSLS